MKRLAIILLLVIGMFSCTQEDVTIKDDCGCGPGTEREPPGNNWEAAKERGITLR